MHHRGGVVGAGRGGDDEPGDVAQRGDGVVVVEMAAEPLLVSVARDPHDHRVAVLAVGEELQRGAFAADLVGGVVQVGEVLDLGDRQQPGHPGAEGEAEDGLFVEEGVEHPGRADLLHQPAGDAVDAALAGDVLAEDQRFAGIGEDVEQGAVDRLGEGQRAVVLGQPAADDPASGGPGRRVGLGGALGARVAQRLHHGRALSS